MTDLPPDTAAPVDTTTDETPPRPGRRDDVLTRFFGGSPIWVLAKLAMLSVVIGVIFAVLGLDAFAILRGLQDLFYDFFDNIWDAVSRLVEWFLLGAVIVFPVWLLMRLARAGAKD